MSRANRLPNSRPDQWLIDQTTFNNRAVRMAEALLLATRTPTEVRALAEKIAQAGIFYIGRLR